MGGQKKWYESWGTLGGGKFRSHHRNFGRGVATYIVKARAKMEERRSVVSIFELRSSGVRTQARGG